jgi:hypothetical protein
MQNGRKQQAMQQLHLPGRTAAASYVMPASPVGPPGPARRGQPDVSMLLPADPYLEPGAYLPTQRQQTGDWLSGCVANFGAGTLERPLRGIPITNVAPYLVQVPDQASCRPLWPLLTTAGLHACSGAATFRTTDESLLIV